MPKAHERVASVTVQPAANKIRAAASAAGMPSGPKNKNCNGARNVNLPFRNF